MNCRFCGYYINRGEITCGHCGNDPNGLKKTRLMQISKIFAGLALIFPVLTAIFSEDINYDLRYISGFIEYHEGNSGVVSFRRLFYFLMPAVYIITIPAFFRIKNCNFGFYPLSAVILFLPAIFVLGMKEVGLVFFFTFPCMLFIAASVTASIDKQNQKVKNNSK